MTTTTGNTLTCDKCGRPIVGGKGYTEIQGWKICGVCQFDRDKNNENKDDKGPQLLLS